MALQKTTLVLTDLAPKWAMVTVLNADLTVAKSFQLSHTTAAKIHARELESIPEDLKSLWEAGRVILESRPCLPGQCVANDVGDLVVNTGIAQKTATKIEAAVTSVPKELWAQVAGEVWLDSTVIRQLRL